MPGDRDVLYHVLAIGEHPVNLALVHAVLDSDVCRVHDAASGAAARRMLKHADFALVVLDLYHPDNAALELAAEIRRAPSTAHVPIVALSARVRPEQRLAALNAGCNEFLPKPVRPAELRAVVGQLLTTTLTS